jgi:adenine-specific DNA methylase
MLAQPHASRLQHQRVRPAFGTPAVARCRPRALAVRVRATATVNRPAEKEAPEAVPAEQPKGYKDAILLQCKFVTFV